MTADAPAATSPAATSPAATPHVYPDGWRVARLRDVCERTSLVNPSLKPDTPFSYVDVSSVSNQAFAIVEPRVMAGSDAPSRARKEIRADDILFATVRPTLRRIALVPSTLDGQVASTGYCVIRPSTGKANPDFIYFHLLSNHVLQRVDELQVGATYPAISDADVLNLAIPLPPLPEQRAIARVLHAAQEAIAARRRQVTLERARKAALMQRLFTHGVRGEATRQTEIGEAPESWQVAKLRDYLREPLKNGVSATEAASGEGVRTLTLAAVTKDDFSVANTKITTADPRRVRDIWLKNGDLFIERANTHELVGTAAIYCGPDRFAIYPDLLIRVRTCMDELDADYLLEYLRTDQCRSYLRRNARGTAGNMPKIDHETVRNLSFPLPPLGEQLEIALLARICNAHIAALEGEIALHDELFRALLEELMSGRLSALGLVEAQRAD